MQFTCLLFCTANNQYTAIFSSWFGLDIQVFSGRSFFPNIFCCIYEVLKIILDFCFIYYSDCRKTLSTLHMCFSVIPCTTGTETYEKMQLQSVLVDLISPHSHTLGFMMRLLCISHKYKCKKSFIILFFCFDCRIDRLSKSKSGL